MKKKILAVLTACLMLTSAVYAGIPYNPAPDTKGVKFTDVPDKHWAKGTIYKLAAQSTKILGGYPDGTFKPDANMTRAEFVTALIRALGYQVTDDVVASYTDVPENHWAVKYIGTAQQKGIIEPADYAGSFKPEGIISRFEACSMLINSFTNTKTVVNDSSVTMYPVFKDAAKLDQKHRKVVHILYRKGVLQGYQDNTAGLDRFATRAELAAFILRFIQNSDKLENYAVTAEDTAELKPYINTNGEYVTYRELLPDCTRTVRGWAKRNPELTEQINYIEWEHIGRNYSGKYKTFMTQIKKRMDMFGNPFKIDYGNANIVAINVTVSYTGKIDGYWVYDYEKLLRNAFFADNNINPVEFKYVCAVEELNGWYNNKPVTLGRFYTNNRTKTYTLIGFSNNLPSTGEIKLYGGCDTANATDFRVMVMKY